MLLGVASTERHVGGVAAKNHASVLQLRPGGLWRDTGVYPLAVVAKNAGGRVRGVVEGVKPTINVAGVAVDGDRRRGERLRDLQRMRRSDPVGDKMGGDRFDGAGGVYLAPCVRRRMWRPGQSPVLPRCQSPWSWVVEVALPIFCFSCKRKCRGLGGKLRLFCRTVIVGSSVRQGGLGCSLGPMCLCLCRTLNFGDRCMDAYRFVPSVRRGWPPTRSFTG